MESEKFILIKNELLDAKYITLLLTHPAYMYVCMYVCAA